jgi:hypothetical protein
MRRVSVTPVTISSRRLELSGWWSRQAVVKRLEGILSDKQHLVREYCLTCSTRDGRLAGAVAALKSMEL